MEGQLEHHNKMDVMACNTSKRKHWWYTAIDFFFCFIGLFIQSGARQQIDTPVFYSADPRTTGVNIHIHLRHPWACVTVCIYMTFDGVLRCNPTAVFR